MAELKEDVAEEEGDVPEVRIYLIKIYLLRWLICYLKFSQDCALNGKKIVTKISNQENKGSKDSFSFPDSIW